MQSRGPFQMGLPRRGGRKIVEICEVDTEQPLLCVEKLSTIDHPNTAHIYGAYYFRGTLSIATENFQMTLDQFTLDGHSLTESEVAAILKEVC